jgi:HEAT repeat protein
VRRLLDADAAVRRAAVEALSRMGEYTALCVEDVAARLEDDDDSVRYAAARLLGEVISDGGVDEVSMRCR